MCAYVKFIILIEVIGKFPSKVRKLLIGGEWCKEEGHLAQQDCCHQINIGKLCDTCSSVGVQFSTVDQLVPGLSPVRNR